MSVVWMADCEGGSSEVLRVRVCACVCSVFDCHVYLNECVFTLLHSLFGQGMTLQHDSKVACEFLGFLLLMSRYNYNFTTGSITRATAYVRGLQYYASWLTLPICAVIDWFGLMKSAAWK